MARGNMQSSGLTLASSFAKPVARASCLCLGNAHCGRPCGFGTAAAAICVLNPGVMFTVRHDVRRPIAILDCGDPT